MEKRPNRKQINFSIRLKTSFAIQLHIDDLSKMKETAEQAGLTSEESKAFLDIMEKALEDSIKIIFPKPFEA